MVVSFADAPALARGLSAKREYQVERVDDDAANAAAEHHHELALEGVEVGVIESPHEDPQRSHQEHVYDCRVDDQRNELNGRVELGLFVLAGGDQKDDSDADEQPQQKVSP